MRAFFPGNNDHAFHKFTKFKVSAINHSERFIKSKRYDHDSRPPKAYNSARNKIEGLKRWAQFIKGLLCNYKDLILHLQNPHKS